MRLMNRLIHRQFFRPGATATTLQSLIALTSSPLVTEVDRGSPRCLAVVGAQVSGHGRSRQVNHFLICFQRTKSSSLGAQSTWALVARVLCSWQGESSPRGRGGECDGYKSKPAKQDTHAFGNAVSRVAHSSSSQTA